MKKIINFCTVSLVSVMMLSSCGQESDMFKTMTQKTTTSEKDDDLGSFAYAEMFSNFSNIDVNITSSEESGKYCAIFTEYPFNEDMDLVIEPILRGHTPINTKISIPKGAEKLYVLSGFDVLEYPVADLYITDSDFNSTNDMTRAETLPASEFNDLKSYIINNKFPQYKNAIFGNDLYKCTDLYADVSEGQQVSVSITFLHSEWNSSNFGHVWFYI